MKRIAHILLLLSFLVAGCSERQTDEFFKWERTDDDFDRVTEALEWNFISRDPLDTIRRNIARLESIQTRNPQSKAMEARVYFWRARAATAGDTAGNGRTYILRARTCADSARRPYEFTRIKHLGAHLSAQPLSIRHKTLRECADFYEHTQDAFMSAHTYIDIANLLMILSDYRNALKLYETADSIYTMNNLEEYRLKNSANIAATRYALGDSATADTMMLSILRNKLTEEDPSFKASVLETLYDRSDKKQYLQEAINIVDRFKQGIDQRQTAYIADMADWHLRHNAPDSALRYCRICRGRMTGHTAAGTSELYYRTYAALLEKQGRYDSACICLKAARAYADSLSAHKAGMEISNREARSHIAKWEYLTKSREEQKRLYLYVLILVIIAGSLTGALIVARRLHRQRMIKATCEMELEKNRRELTYSQLVMTEKDNLLTTLMDDISKLRKDGNLSAQEAEVLKQNIRVHQSGKNEWENFKILFEQLHPSFSRQLRESHPDLTDGDVRLASYLRLGLSSKQIARMLMLQPESVKKNRMRLRTRLGLQSGQSLEEYLRRFPEEK